ncbi:hypothetical protein [Longimicrobium sp.]|uniref:hypothetical protein n=1 Tax=Longimicrobium sp. TaxID=2029185 RepID=UPI003B3B1645
MTRILALLLVLFGATDAAAQPAAGAYEVPMGNWEYRWLTRRDADGNVRREAATGHLRLVAGGLHDHLRTAEGATLQSMGSYRTEGHLLLLPRTDMDNRGRMAVDTFAVRHIGDRIFLWREGGGETMEYTLAPPGAPAEPAVVPGIIPGIHAFVQSVTFFESDGGPMPRPQRRYATAFRVDSTRYVNVQIDLSHPIALADGTLPVACNFVNVELGASFLLEWPAEVRRGNASSGLSTGFGTADPGHWRPGTYRVACTVNGVAIPEAGFTMQ